MGLIEVQPILLDSTQVFLVYFVYHTDLARVFTLLVAYRSEKSMASHFTIYYAK